ncbi:lysozyme [Klebsiella pneumoniae]|uniref:Lysozyme n=1 Tax=Klebsiella pneumoniae TaxID=573 RepID=A0A377U367_KLEPN|nr:lysozyme [Klebsiella pneumoniae]
MEKALDRCVLVSVPQNVYDALVSLAFNVGTGNACSSTMVKFINKKRWRDACYQLLAGYMSKAYLIRAWKTAAGGSWPGA